MLVLASEMDPRRLVRDPLLGLSPRNVQRWRQTGRELSQDGRRRRNWQPPNQLTEAERAQVLATANSAIMAVDKLKRAGANNLRFVCLLAAPEGVENFTKAHPDVPIVTAAIDSHLNENGYIVPGLGDAGDRMYGTK